MIPIKVDKICLETGKVLATYDSIRDASRAVGVHKNAIDEALNKPSRTCKNFRWKSHDPRQVVIHTIDAPAKILILDIETAPMDAWVWNMWKQNIYAGQLISDWYMLTWSVKWLGEEEVDSDRLTSEEAIMQDDSRLLRNLWGYLEEADVVVAHNGDKFDVPRIKTRFLANGLNPPSFYKQLDTLKVAKKEFDFPHNSLDAIANFLGLEGKLPTDMKLWIAARTGDIDALSEMEEYNIQDVRVLEDVYLRLRPWIKSHPNLDLYVDSSEPTCPHCGSKNINVVPGKYVYTQAVKYQMLRCSDCRAIARSKKGIKFEYKKQVSAIPR